MFFTNNRDSEFLMNRYNYYLMDFELSNKCKKFCSESKNCLSEIFELSETKREEEKCGFRVTISPATNPSLKFKHSPKIQIEEFLYYIASIISLWFEFSILILSDVCLFVIKKVKKISNHINVTNNLTINNNSLPLEITRSRMFLSNNRN